MSENQSWFENGNPKFMFAFGLVTGVAVISLLVSGSLLSSSGVLKITRADANSGQADEINADNSDDSAPVVAPTVKYDVPEITNADHVIGDIDGKVVLIEYSDFECPYCGKHHPNMEKIQAEYGDKITWVYRHFPLSFHENALSAAVASECASEQGKFWEFADAMFDNQSDLGTDLYEATALELGLDVSTFTACLDSGKYNEYIDEQTNAGADAGVNGTPATFLNGELISGAVPYSTLKAKVDSALAE